MPRLSRWLPDRRFTRNHSPARSLRHGHAHDRVAPLHSVSPASPRMALTCPSSFAAYESQAKSAFWDLWQQLSSCLGLRDLDTLGAYRAGAGSLGVAA